MKNIIGMILAIVSVAGILSACGDGNKSLPRVVECPECSEAQLKVLLGRDASKATSGKNIVLTLQLTEANHDEIVAWISDGGNTPNALCREIVYEAVADHNAFIDTQRWAIVRNNTTLFVDNRQEHGTYLIDGYVSIALAPDTNPSSLIYAEYNESAHEHERAYNSVVTQAKSIYNASIPVDPNIAYNATRSKFAQHFEDAVYKEPKISITRGYDAWHGAWGTSDEKCNPQSVCNALREIKSAREKADKTLAEAERIRATEVSKITSIRDVAIAEAKRIYDIAITEAKSIRVAAIAEVERIDDSERTILRQHRKTHSALSNAYQPGDIIHILEQGKLDNSLPVNEYRVIAILNTRLLSYPIALPNGQAANNCNAAPTATGQYYVSESGSYAWQGWR